MDIHIIVSFRIQEPRLMSCLPCGAEFPVSMVLREKPQRNRDVSKLMHFIIEDMK